MTCRRHLSVFFSVACGALFAGGSVTRSSLANGGVDGLTADPDIRFIEVLRDRGDYGVALDYLQRVAEGAVATPALRTRAAYELAVTRLQQAGSLRDARRRTAAVAQARRELERFVQGAEDPELVADGRSRLAGALAVEGARLVARAEAVGGTGGRPAGAATLSEALAAFDSARELYRQAIGDYAKAIEDAGQAPAENERRRLLRARGLQARLYAATALFDKANAYPAESAGFKRLHAEAADEFFKIYDTNRKQPLGLYAQLFEGRCYQALGDHKRARGALEELISRDPTIDVYREALTLGHAHLIESRLATGEGEEALDRAEGWLDGLTAAERSGGAAATLRYHLARGAVSLAEAEDLVGGRRTRSLSRARAWLRRSVGPPHPFRTAARELLLQVNAELGTEPAALATFSQALQAGREAVAALSAATMAEQAARAASAADLGPLSEQKTEAERDARRAWRAALRLAGSEAAVAEVNEARYQLAYLHWQAEEYLEAAAISEFLTLGFPDDPLADRSAMLAMASLEKLAVADPPGSDSAAGAFAGRHLRRVAEHITARWAGRPLADSAYSVLLSLALREGDLADAQRLVGQAPPPGRALLGVKLGSVMWERASRAAARAGDDPAAVAAAEGAKVRAMSVLQEHFQVARQAGAITPSVATAGLYLALAKLSDGDAAAAIELLEDNDSGAVRLVERGDPAAERAGFAAETCKAAIRAYLAVLPPRTADAIAMMDRLEAANGDEAGATTRVYFALGVQLQRQVERRREAGRTRDADRLAAAFAQLLQRLSERAGDASWRMQLWVGQTLLTMADNARDQPTRQRYADKAVAMLESMLKRSRSDPAFAPGENALLALRIQLARALDRAGEHARAIDLFADVLAERNVLLDVQKQAAYALQAWGREQPERLLDAIRGDRQDPQTNKNTVWGWVKLAGVAAQVGKRQPKYQELFYESWLNVARCRYLLAQDGAGAERTKNLQSARKTITAIRRSHPELGGAELRGRYDRLMRDIQQLEGKPPTGLAELGPARERAP